MSTFTPTTISSQNTNPIQSALVTLAAAIGRVKPPPHPGMNPGPGWFEAVADHIREVASLCDDWASAIGHQVRDNASAPLEMTQFDAPFLGAVDGNATYICEAHAEMLREEHREVA